MVRLKGIAVDQGQEVKLQGVMIDRESTAQDNAMRAFLMMIS